MLAKSLAATVITSTLKLLVPILLGSAVDHTQIMLSNPSGAVGATATLYRGFHSPANRVRLDELLVDNVLPKKGRLSKANREREQGETFAAMRRQHPAVESAINNLEHCGLDRVRSKGRKGFARSVALAVVALNVHRLGRVLRQQALERHRPAA